MKEEQFVSADPLAEIEINRHKEETRKYKESIGCTKNRCLVVGCWDLVHAGHAEFIKRVYWNYCHYSGMELHVGVAHDECFKRFKGREPIYPIDQRMALLKVNRWVDGVHEYRIWKDSPSSKGYPEDGHKDLLDAVKPLLFVESRQKPKENIGILPYLRERGIPIKYVDSIDIHTSDIIRRIRGELS